MHSEHVCVMDAAQGFPSRNQRDNPAEWQYYTPENI